jgi:hypothetical protein
VLPATLGKTPRTLAELWEEYEYGIGNWKSAKATERGNTRLGIKQKYWRQKHAFYTIEVLMARGDRNEAAIDRIRNVYDSFTRQVDC